MAETWDRPAARKQIGRMSQMFKFPSDVDALGELIDAIQTAETLVEAKAVVSEIMRDATGDTPCPMPSDLRRLVMARLEPKRPDPDCLECGGCGTVFVKVGDATGAKECSCWARRPEPQYVKTKLPKELRAQLKEARSVTRG